MNVPGKARIAVAALTLSAAGFVGIMSREDIKLEAYADPVHGWAVPTIGAGSTEGVKRGDTITPLGAVQRSLREVGVYEGAIRGCVKAPLHQHEFDAYTQLAHNIGARAFCVNPKTGGPAVIPRHLNANPPDYEGACNAILEYRRAGDVDCSTPGNKVCAGLWKDRLRVHALCKGGA